MHQECKDEATRAKFPKQLTWMATIRYKAEWCKLAAVKVAGTGAFWRAGAASGAASCFLIWPLAS